MLKETKVRGFAVAILIALLLPGSVFAAGGSVHLDPAHNDVGNIASLQRGVRNFVNYCMGCHSAQYVRYNRLAQDLQITEDQVIQNLMFAADKPTETMTIAMPPADAERWFGVAAPDLSLIARSRGTDYIYTFLRSFYVEEGRPTGVNNRVLENTAMPHVLWELQGTQRAVFEEVSETDAGGNKTTRSVFREFELIEPGRLSPEEYDSFVRDIVNFLDYVGEPMQLQRTRLGAWVIVFLLVFGLFSYLLKEEIWKDIK